MNSYTPLGDADYTGQGIDTKSLRLRANEIARRAWARLVAEGIVKDPTRKAPTCHRIVRRRGRGYSDKFSIPAWAAQFPDYFSYYVAHEVCHGAVLERGHGTRFMVAERLALNSLGMFPFYENGGAGPYVEALVNVNTGEPKVIRINKQFVAPPVVLEKI